MIALLLKNKKAKTNRTLSLIAETELLSSIACSSKKQPRFPGITLGLGEGRKYPWERLVT
jgi:hypothetical protein